MVERENEARDAPLRQLAHRLMTECATEAFHRAEEIDPTTTPPGVVQVALVELARAAASAYAYNLMRNQLPARGIKRLRTEFVNQVTAALREGLTK